MSNEDYKLWLTHPTTEEILKQLDEFWADRKELILDNYWSSPEKHQSPDMLFEAARAKAVEALLQQIRDGDFVYEE